MPIADAEPDQAVLVELGRVTWWAIVLEGLVDSLCAWIKPVDPRTDRRTIGQKRKDARSELRTWPESPVREQADAWLTRAYAALEERNGLFHATAVHDFGDGASGAPHAAMLLMEDYLQHRPQGVGLATLPRDRGAYVEVSTPEALVAITDQLREAGTGWRELVGPVDEARKRVWAERGQ